MRLGVDRLLRDDKLKARLKGRRLALLAHPASMTADFLHSVDALARCPELKLAAAFGPQHGMRGDKQDNMIESEDYFDPLHKFPVSTLSGKVRLPPPKMIAPFDPLLFDPQDVGCGIYTFPTTLLYVLKTAARPKTTVWVLDPPKPAG